MYLGTAVAIAVVAVVVPSVLELIEAARMKAGASHKELACNRGLTADRWSQKVHGVRSSHVHLEDILVQPPAFVLAFADALRERFGAGPSPATREDVEAVIRAVLDEREARRCA